MARQQTVNDNAEFLTYALIHLEKERDIVLAKIANIKQQLSKQHAEAERHSKSRKNGNFSPPGIVRLEQA